jgi:hypothetical protein
MGESMTVTFDTDTLDKAAPPGRHPKEPNQGDGVKVNGALPAERLMGYFRIDWRLTDEGKLFLYHKHPPAVASGNARTGGERPMRTEEIQATYRL